MKCLQVEEVKPGTGFQMTISPEKGPSRNSLLPLRRGETQTCQISESWKQSPLTPHLHQIRLVRLSVSVKDKLKHQL